MQIKVNFQCRDSILAAPIVLDLALLGDLAQRAGEKGPQEWLSFFFKSPVTAPGQVRDPRSLPAAGGAPGAASPVRRSGSRANQSAVGLAHGRGTRLQAA